MLKVIAGQNNTAAYVIPQDQCRVYDAMHYITMYSIEIYVYNDKTS